MKNILKLLSLTLFALVLSGFAFNKPPEDEKVKDFLSEISEIMGWCYGIETLQGTGCLHGKEAYISLDFSADYNFSEMHAKKVVLDTMREICIRLGRFNDLSKLLPNRGFDPCKIQISIKVVPKKHHRIFPAIMFLESIRKDSQEGCQLLSYVEAKDGKIKYYAKPSKFSSRRKLFAEESLGKAIADVTSIDTEKMEIIQVPPIPKNNVIYTEFIFQRTGISMKKKYGIKPMSWRRRCIDKIELLDTSYEVPNLVSKEEARNILFLCLNEMLHEIHIDDAIQPHLVEGFNESNLEVTLYIGESDVRAVYPDISTVSYKNGKINYRYDDPDHQWSTKKWITETFEEAVTLVDKEKLDVKYISAYSEHYK